MFYNFNQNNSGGSFIVNDKVCHRLFIEADNFDDAVFKAEDLGCYWNGVDDGRDCPCCGDRWTRFWNEPVPIEEYEMTGYTVSVYDGIYGNASAEWHRRYGKYKIVEVPKLVTKHGYTSYTGKICFSDIKEYAQYLADEYGWTAPDARIYYKDGSIKEIFSERRAVSA